MKRIALLAMMLASPALAQQPPAPPGQRALEIMLNREMTAHQSDLGAAIQMQGQIEDLTKKVADLTKERDALKVPPSASDTGK